LFKKKQLITDTLKEELDRVLDELSGLSSTSKEYEAAVKQYDILYKLWSSTRKKSKFTGDALLNAGAHVFGLGMILGFEKFNVITSKAIGFVIKPNLKSGPIIK
jgi:hypothetical protein